tara:strand:+ start:398 stop:1900 length:1503 start_codon:yes stop_codon:yes gene_type:complete
VEFQKKLGIRKPFSRAGILLLAVVTFASACGDSKEYSEDDGSSTVEDSSEISSIVSDVDEVEDEDDTFSEGSDPEVGEGEDEDDTFTDDTVEAIECPWDVGWKSANATGGVGSSAWGTGDSLLEDARLGAHNDYDRFVLEFKSGDSIPSSYNIMWLAVEHTGAEGVLDVASPAGDVFLEIGVGASYMPSSESAPYFTGPYRITNPLLGNIQEAVSVGASDGRITWQLGSNEANGFRVFELEEPSRLVIDVCISDASSTKGEDCIDSGMPPGLCGALFDYTGGYTGAHAEHAEMFGSGECPAAPELTATAFTTPSYFTDLDGDGDTEEAFTYYETYDEGMYLRVIDGADKIDFLLASGAYIPSGNAVVGAIDLQTDDEPELFVTTQSGSPGSPRGVLLFQIEDCELVTIKKHGADFSFSLTVGNWSAGGHSYGIDCVDGAPVLRELHSYPGSSTPPVTTWLWTRTTHELLSDNTMEEVSISDEFSGSEVPWSVGFNSCDFE